MNSLSCLSDIQLKDFVQNLVFTENQHEIKNTESKAWVPINNDEFGHLIEELIRYGENIGKLFGKNFLVDKLMEIVKSTQDVFKSSTDHRPKLLLYEFLQKLYQQTTPVDRQIYFHKILNIYCLISKERSDNLEKGIIRNLVKIFLPYLKVQKAVQELSQHETLGSPSLQELLECIFCPRILREDCYQILFEKTKTSNYKILSFDMVPIKEVFGYTGNYFNLNISIEQDSIKKDFVFFTKCLPLEDFPFKSAALELFKKEQFLYEELIPKIKGLGIDNISNFAPQYYFARTDDVLVLENMTFQNYFPLNNTIPADYDLLVDIMKRLSELHACSILLDKEISRHNKDETIGTKYRHMFDEIILNRNYQTGAAIYVGCRTITDYFLEKFPNIMKKLSLEAFKKKVSSEIDLMYKHVGSSKKYVNVICHRDLWGGNILTKTNRDKLSNCCIFIDYQGITYSPPAIDLLYVIYTNADKTIRDNSMADLIDLYYSNLRDNLSKYEINLQEICEYEIFLEMVNDFKCGAIIQALCYLQILLCPIIKEVYNDEEKSKKFTFEDRSDIFDKCWNCEPFKTRIEELIEDLCEILKNK